MVVNSGGSGKNKKKVDAEEKEETVRSDSVRSNDESKDESKGDDVAEGGKKTVPNMFSYIPCNYNDLTNFYLTSDCLVPSNEKSKVYGVADTQFVLSVHFHKQLQWHRHPKLRVYQYFNGGGMRFFDGMFGKKIDGYVDLAQGGGEDMTALWPRYFADGDGALSADEVAEMDVFDDVLDLYKCDAQFFQWDNAIKRANGLHQSAHSAAK